MMEECNICCDIRFVKVCGANNNCNVKVCNDCFENCQTIDNFICPFCMCYDYRRELIGYIDYINNESGGDSYSDKSYVVLNKFVIKNESLLADIVADNFEEIPYCFDCDVED